jgi:excisionase family DNA binding protein
LVQKSSPTELLTIKEFAKLVKIAPKTLYRLASTGKIPCIRIGRNLRFSPDMIDQMRQGGDQ